MKKLIIALLVLMPLTAMAFNPATLYKGSSRKVVHTKIQAQKLFDAGYKLEINKSGMIGSAAATGTVGMKWVQSQPYTLAGSGATLGATTIVLKSLKNIDGTLLTMSDFGLEGFGTIEPSTKNEEQISFTGVTQNANGTATLTGVSTVLNKYPYTETSGLAMTHSGGTYFVLSNTAGFYNTFVNKENSDTLNGTYTFNQFPLLPTSTPTNAAQAINKAYADLLTGTSSYWLPSGLNIYNANTGNVGIGTNPFTVSTKLQLGNIASSSNPYQFLLGQYYKVTTSSVPQIVGNWADQNVYWGFGPATGANDDTLQLGMVGGLGSSYSWASANQGNMKLIVGSTTIGTTNTFNGTTTIGGATTINGAATFNGTTTIIKAPASTTDATNKAYVDGLTYLPISTNGIFTIDMAQTSGTTTSIVTNLGTTPRKIRFYCTDANTTAVMFTSLGTYNGASSSVAYSGFSNSTDNSGANTTNVIYLPSNSSTNGYQKAVVTSMTSTSTLLTWTKGASPTGSAYCMWETN